MLLIRVCLLWGLVSVHVLGGAILFRRFLPRESPWFGFVVPAIVLVLVLDFIEHAVAVTALHFLLPVSTLGSLWLIISPRTRWRFLWRPALVFLLAFAVTLFLKCLATDINASRDGVVDLSLISNFCMGETLPVESTWIPPVKLLYYHSFGHYAAAVMVRLLGLDVGTGYNVASALLSALIYFFIAATAWRIGGYRMWIVFLALFLTVCASTGSTPILWLTQKEPFAPQDAMNLLNRTDDAKATIPFAPYIHRIGNWYKGRELTVPGYWSWMSCYHSTIVGQLWTLLAVYSLAEITRRRRTDWPWICLFGSVLLMLISCAWGFPILVLILVTSLAWCAWRRVRPRDWRYVVMILGGMLVLLTPLLLYFLNSPAPYSGWPDAEDQIQPAEYILQWWPVYLPAFALVFYWRRVNPAVIVVTVVALIGLLWVHFYNIGARFDMTGKNWGFIWCTAWTVFVPALAASRAWMLRGVLALLVAGSVLSLCFWIDYEHRTWNGNGFAQLEGHGEFQTDDRKARLLSLLSTLKYRTVITGKSYWAYCESPLLANFTLNRDYATWTFSCDVDIYPNSHGTAYARELELDDLYAGKIADPLAFLRQRKIAALVIWPDDRIPDAVVAKLQQSLAPDFRYEDCRSDHPPKPPNAGVFLPLPGRG